MIILSAIISYRGARLSMEGLIERGAVLAPRGDNSPYSIWLVTYEQAITTAVSESSLLGVCLYA
jgi:hypothetical protein